ncbi:hypothetical protein D3C80_1932390 [compost metagenome]
MVEKIRKDPTSHAEKGDKNGDRTNTNSYSVLGFEIGLAVFGAPTSRTENGDENCDRVKPGHHAPRSNARLVTLSRQKCTFSKRLSAFWSVSNPEVSSIPYLFDQ